MAAKSLFMVTVLGSVAVFVLQAADRPDLNGSWQLDPAHSEMHTQIPQALAWQINQSGDTIHITENAGGKSLSDVTCIVDGRECKVKDSGHTAKFSFYFNGPVLVELEAVGNDNLVKRRIHPSADGSTLTVDVMHVLPSGKEPEKLIMTRKPGAQIAASSAR